MEVDNVLEVGDRDHIFVIFSRVNELGLLDIVEGQPEHYFFIVDGSVVDRGPSFLLLLELPPGQKSGH